MKIRQGKKGLADDRSPSFLHAFLRALAFSFMSIKLYSGFVKKRRSTLNPLDLLASKEITGVNLLPLSRLDFSNTPRINYGHCDPIHLVELFKSLSDEKLTSDINILQRFSRYLWDSTWTTSSGVVVEDFHNIHIAKEEGYLLELFPKNGALNDLINWLLSHCVKGQDGAIEGSWEVPYITLIGIKEHKNFLPANEIIIPDTTLTQSSFVSERFKTKLDGLFERKQLLYTTFYEFVTQN